MSATPVVEQPGPTPPGPAHAPEGDVASHRRRQASVAAILDQVFGPFGVSDPKLWERRAYLLLVGSVYERLATDAEVGTDELVKLARVLAESRRSKSSTARRGPADDAAPSSASGSRGNGRSSEGFAALVRNVYGTDNEDERRSRREAADKACGGVGG